MAAPHSISELTSADHTRALKVWEDSVRATHTFLTEADIQSLKPLVVEHCLKHMTLFCVRDETESVVGFLGVDEPKIEALFVDPRWMGQGIGRAMVEYAIHDLQAQLVDVNEQNDQALGFYLHLGFEVAHRSERDGFGKPFPLLHLKLPG